MRSADPPRSPHAARPARPLPAPWLGPLALALCLAPRLATAEPRPAAALVQPAPPPAAEPAPGASVEDQVDARVQEASEHFSAGRYPQSARALRAAYALDPQPIFLFNIAQSERRGQLLREALDDYQRFLKADPRTSLRAETNGYVLELTHLLEKQEQLERERRKPLWRKPWFWGLVAGGAAVAAAGVGLGVGLGLRDNRTVIDLNP